MRSNLVVVWVFVLIGTAATSVGAQPAPSVIESEGRRTTNVYNAVGLKAHSETIDTKTGKVLIRRFGHSQNVEKEEFAERIENLVLGDKLINVYTLESDYHPARVVSASRITFYAFDEYGRVKSSVTWENEGTMLEPTRGNEILRESLVKHTGDYKTILDRSDLRNGDTARIVVQKGMGGRVGGRVLSETRGDELFSYEYVRDHYAGFIPRKIVVTHKKTRARIRELLIDPGSYDSKRSTTTVREMDVSTKTTRTREWTSPWRLVYHSTTN